MKSFPKGEGYIVEDVSELPRLKGTNLIMDFETTSGDKSIKSLNPFRNCKICGIAITHDKLKEAFYVPVAHNPPYQQFNLPRESVIPWLADVLKDHVVWSNQNIKYDAHVLYNDFGLDFHGPLICTINARAKLENSERIYTGGYGLEVLSEQLLKKDIRSYMQSLEPYKKYSQDYGDIHPYVLGPYACIDVKSVQELDEYFLKAIPEELKPTVDLEVRTTKALVHMERKGMRIKPFDVAIEQLRCMARVRHIEQEAWKRLNKWVNFQSPTDMYDVICNIFQLPVVEYTNEDDDTKDSNPSFSKSALREYKGLVGEHLWFIDLAEEARELSTFQSLFLQTYINENIDGILHPTYNQIVRTGRMSCSRPNMQQLSTRAKNLIIPNQEGWGIFRADYSQIEQRIICHYLNDPAILKSFLENPDMDSYEALARRARCERDVAKVISLGVSYGMGLKKLIKWLSSIKEIVAHVTQSCESELLYRRLASDSHKKEYVQRKLGSHCKTLFQNFHRGMPKLKPMSEKAESSCRAKGYVRTLLGRQRHLSAPYARKAFNAASQGSAADLIKHKVVEFVELLQNCDVHLIAQVHDELVFTGPMEILSDPRFFRDVAEVMETNPLPMEIPIRVSAGYSSESWADASRKEKTSKKQLDPLFDSSRHEMKLDHSLKGSGEQFSWLKTRGTNHGNYTNWG